MRKHWIAPLVATLTAGVVLSGCGGSDTGAPTTVAPPRASAADPSGSLPQGDESVTLDPADFTTEIDNPYWPMSPGSRWVFIEGDPEGTREDVVVEVTDRTKMIANGVEARVVIDTVSANGVPVEITEDWYAQDEVGNIWYQEQVEVPFGYFNRDVLMTRDMVPTEPKVQELEFYAPGVGPLLSMHTGGPGGSAALIRAPGVQSGRSA